MPVDSDADILGMFDAEEFGVAATWGPGWKRPWPRTLVMDFVTLTGSLTAETADLVVIRDNPTDNAGAFSASGSVARRDAIMLPSAAIGAEPLHGDQVTVDGAAAQVAQTESDIDRRLWRATLAKA